MFAHNTYPKAQNNFIVLLSPALGPLTVCWECKVLVRELVSTCLFLNHAAKCSYDCPGEALGTTTVLINGR